MATTKAGYSKPMKIERVDTPPKDFYWDYSDEPHASRRKEILAKCPQIKELYGHEPSTKYVIFLLVSIQVTAAYLVRDLPWWKYIAIAYVIGGTCNHMLMLGMHEVCHNLVFRKSLHNKLYGLFANLPVGVPSSVSFKRYHMEHHRYQGEDGIDVDIPTYAEGSLFQTTFRKLLFVICQVLFYALRPVIVNPKTPGIWEYLNVTTCVLFNASIVYFMGWSSLGYLLLSTFLGSGLHPVAGHFIAEHYVFIKGFETYSYYGVLNFFAFNVGYHNEHHDFPFVAGPKLPLVRSMAPEFYDNLPRHNSWVRVIYEYITDPNVNAFSRVKRHRLTDEETKKLKTQ